MLDYVERSLVSGFKPTYVKNMVNAVKSWLEHFGLKVDRKIKLPAADDVDEIVPTKEQLAQIFRRSNHRTRVTESLIGFGGLRPETIGNYLGTDGLRLGDLPELTLSESRVTVEKIPMTVRVRRTLSKGRHSYFTYLSREGCQYLKDYLEIRVKSGEKLTPESPVIGHLKPGRNQFLRTTKLASDVKDAMKRAGFTWRPYVLRSYCDTAFDIAESRGLISHPWRTFFMGHKGDIEARYSTNKQRLPPNMIEEMRASYGRCESLLTTAEQPDEELALRHETKIEDLTGKIETYEETIAFMFDRIAELEKAYAKATGRKIPTFKVTLPLDQDKSQESARTLHNGGSENREQKVVDIGEVESYLSDGWRFVGSLNPERCIIEQL